MNGNRRFSGIQSLARGRQERPLHPPAAADRRGHPRAPRLPGKPAPPRILPHREGPRPLARPDRPDGLGRPPLRQSRRPAPRDRPQGLRRRASPTAASANPAARSSPPTTRRPSPAPAPPSTTAAPSPPSPPAADLRRARSAPRPSTRLWCDPRPVSCGSGRPTTRRAPGSRTSPGSCVGAALLVAPHPAASPRMSKRPNLLSKVKFDPAVERFRLDLKRKIRRRVPQGDVQLCRALPPYGSRFLRRARRDVEVEGRIGGAVNEAGNPADDDEIDGVAVEDLQQLREPKDGPRSGLHHHDLRLRAARILPPLLRGRQSENPSLTFEAAGRVELQVRMVETSRSTPQSRARVPKRKSSSIALKRAVTS